MFFIVIQISSSLRTASIRAESAPLEWGGSQLVSRENQHQPPPAQGGGGPACSLPDLSQLHIKFISITSDHNNCGSDHHQRQISQQLPQPVLRLLRAMLPQLDCYRNSIRPKRGHRASAQLAATRISTGRRSSLSTHPSTANGGVSAFVRLCGY